MDMTSPIGLKDFQFQPLPEPGSQPFDKSVFLDLLQETGSVKDACLSLGVTEKTAYVAKRKDKAFSEEWNALIQDGALDKLEAEAVRRALSGSDSLLIFMLKAGNRKRYDDALARAASESKDIQIRIQDVAGRIKTK
jgi:hypothetical protein